VVPQGAGCAVDRWAAEAAILLGAEGRAGGAVAVRLGGRHRLVLDLASEGDMSGPPALKITAAPANGCVSACPVLPHAATWVLPDLELLRAGLIDADRLHPLVAAALVPGHPLVGVRRIQDSGGDPRLVECRGAQHRIGPVNGVLVPLDHDPAEIRREELLAALGGTPLPCLRADPATAVLPDRGDLRQAVLDGVVEAVRKRPEKSRREAAWALLVVALETGAPDLVVVPAATLATLRCDDWEVPASIERLAGVVSLSQRADRAGVRVGSGAGTGR
jgi:hypothetical protein